MTGHCIDCGREWDALGEAHCASCCKHFTSDSAFDAHQRLTADGDVLCRDPAEVKTKKGRPILVLTERASGPAWMRASDGEHHFAKARRARTIASDSTNRPRGESREQTPHIHEPVLTRGRAS